MDLFDKISFTDIRHNSWKFNSSDYPRLFVSHGDIFGGKSA